MSIELTRQDRENLERLARSNARPIRRRRALALLEMDRGVALPEVSTRSGIAEEELAGLADLFRARGLAGLGLIGPRDPRQGRPRSRTIERTPGICGGSARVSGTRILVWALVEARDLGVSEAQLLLDYPDLRAANLVDAWEYAEDHPDEIADEIRQNEVE